MKMSLPILKPTHHELIMVENIISNSPDSLSHYGLWHVPSTITVNGFRHKSLSCWALNRSVGCPFGCRFCYVPDASTKKLARPLGQLGVQDPDAEWGRYTFLRPLDERAFLRSLDAAERTPIDELNPDGNRAVILSSTTDPFPVFAGPDPAKNKELNTLLRETMVKSLELIRDRSTINVRILTRSPLARQFFDVFKTFGDRLVFGMSLPTLNNEAARIYEPKAPAPTQRLATLKAAKEAGLHVYVAMAPTYPECDIDDLAKTLEAIKALDPITIFHEPINIRAENVERIAAHARAIGRNVQIHVFATPITWRAYAIESLVRVEHLAQDMGLIDRLHLWPDPDLASESAYLKMRHAEWKHEELTKFERQQRKLSDRRAYQRHRDWLAGWWSKISDWPGQPSGRRLTAFA